MHRILQLLILVLLTPLNGDSLFVDAGGGSPGDNELAELRLLNESRIVGIQFDINVPLSQASLGSPLPETNLQFHQVTSGSVGDATRVVIFSPTNQEVPDDELLTIPLNLSESAPEGGPVVEVSNVIFTNASGDSVSSVVFYRPLEQWKLERFDVSQRLDPLIVGDFADPDNDGYINLEEFLFATDPMSADAPGLLQGGLTYEDGGEGVSGKFLFSFDFPQVIGSDGARLVIESSEDLITWTKHELTAVPTGQSDGITRMMRLTLETDKALFPKRFFRLDVERTESNLFQPESVEPLSYLDWLAGYLSAAQLADPAIAGEQVDPDGDKIVNLLEYLIGSDPLSPNGSFLPEAGVFFDEGNIRRATLNYNANRQASDVSLVIEASSDLQIWKPVNDMTFLPTGRANSLSFELMGELSGEAPDKQFFRFSAQRP